ncbi:MAG: hypothetical protein Q8M53_10820 [Burkholderiales bacterium]|nr:hypothetical protein [Burkholderiales bacterium]
MNLAQIIGEQRLRIDELEDMLQARGIAPHDAAELRDLRTRLRAEIDARESDAERHRQEQRRLEEIAEGLRKQLQGSALQLKLDAEIKARAAEAHDYRRRIALLEAQARKSEGHAAGQLPAATPERRTEKNPAPAAPAAAARRGRTGPIPFREGTLGAAVLRIFDSVDRGISFPEIRTRISESREDIAALNWVLLSLVRNERLTRTGTRRHYLYSKPQKQQGENNA